MSHTAKRDLVWIEAARTLAMALVIIVHSTGAVLQGNFKPGWPMLLSTSGRLAVPAFFMISGFLLGRRPTGPAPATFWAPLLKSRFKSLILPFLVWNLVYMFVFRLDLGWPILSGATLWFLTTGYVQLWFVFVLLQFLFLYPLLEPYLQGRGLPRVLWAATGLSLLFYTLADALAWLGVADQGHYFEWHYGKAFAGWSLFFFWGVWLGRNPTRLPAGLRHRLGLGILTLASLWFYYWETDQELTLLGFVSRQYFLISGLVFQFLGANLFLALLLGWDQSNRARGVLVFLARWGRDTYGVYLGHFAILLGLGAIWQNLGPNLEILVLATSTALLSLGLVHLLRRPGLSIGNSLLFGGR